MLTTAHRIETFSDMVQAMVDTGGSCSMGTKTTDFKNNSLHPSNKVVKTYNGDFKANLQEGELDWTSFTDAGIDAPLPLTRSLLVPHAAGRIPSPQHWTKNMLKLYPDCKVHMEMVDGKYFVLSWTLNSQRIYVQTQDS
jgi:hypothetical protein